MTDAESTEAGTGDEYAVPSTPAEELARHRGYSEQLRRQLERMPPATDVAELMSAASEARRLAEGPMTIGVVGEYSAGKSLLIGLLVDDPALLPIGDDPVTGNVTALRLRQAPESQTRTAVDAVDVEYFDAGALAGCVRAMVDDMAGIAREARVPEPDITALIGLRDLPDPWAGLERWGRAVGWPTQEPSLRAAVRELMRLRDAATRATSYLGLTSRLLDVDDRHEALRLQPVPSSAEFPEPHIPDTDLGHRPRHLAAAQLAETWPLVARVTMHVSVPRSVWDLTALSGDNELVLLDFPGIDARESGLRDRHLCRQALTDVPTILILLNSLAAARRGTTEFPRMLQRVTGQLDDAVLVGIGRFDQLPNPLPSWLVGDDPAADDRPVVEADLTGGPLRAVLGTAGELLGADPDSVTELPRMTDRTCFHSAMVAIGALQRRDPLAVRIDALTGKVDLATLVPPAERRAATWSRIGERLAAADPRSLLGPALVEFGADGGVRHLRRMIEDHVLAHGARQRLERCRNRSAALETRKLLLVDRLRDQRIAAPRSGADAGRDDIEERIMQVGRLVEALGDRARTELSDPGTVPSADGGTLTALVSRDAAAQVFAWPQWSALFNALQDGVITSTTGGDLEWLLGDDEPGSAPIPATADDFREPFEAACTACTETGRTATWAALDRWGRRGDIELSAHRTALAPVLRTARERVAGSPAALKYLRVLEAALEPSTITAGARALVEMGLATSDPVRRERSFPLRPGSGFAWAADAPPAVGNAVGTLSRHQIRPARLRREFVNAVRRTALEELGGQHHALADETSRRLTSVSVALLQDRARQVAFLDAVLDATPAAHVVDPGSDLATIVPPQPYRSR